MAGRGGARRWESSENLSARSIAAATNSAMTLGKQEAGRSLLLATLAQVRFGLSPKPHACSQTRCHLLLEYTQLPDDARAGPFVRQRTSCTTRAAAVSASPPQARRRSTARRDTGCTMSPATPGTPCAAARNTPRSMLNTPPHTTAERARLRRVALPSSEKCENRCGGRGDDDVTVLYTVNGSEWPGCSTWQNVSS